MYVSERCLSLCYIQTVSAAPHPSSWTAALRIPSLLHAQRQTEAACPPAYICTNTGTHDLQLSKQPSTPHSILQLTPPPPPRTHLHNFPMFTESRLTRLTPTPTPPHTHLCNVLPGDLYEEGHGIVHDVVPPGELQDHVRPQEVEAGVEAGSKAVLAINLKEPGNEVLCHRDLSRLSCILHCILWRRGGLVGVS